MIKGTKRINDSQLSNDMSLIGGASLIIARKFKRILDVFLDTSRGAVNMIKCQIYGWHSSLEVMHQISKTRQFSLVEEWSFFRYLGITISIKGPSA
jgi:hypothetical protein